MIKSWRSPLLSLVLAAALLPLGPTSARDDVGITAGDGTALQMNAVRISNVRKKMGDRFTQADREAAAKNLKELKARLEAAKKTVRTKQAAEAAANGMSFAVETPPGIPPPGPGDVPDYFTTANWAFSPPLRKFVDKLAGLGPTGANGLGNYIPVAVPDTTTYPGSDYYEIWLEEYEQQLHSDLLPTRLRGYRQVNGPNPEAKPRYLGPVIVAQRDRPVRILFRNKLPSGTGGDLFIPVDESIMGAGMGPLFPDGSPCDPTPPALENCAKYPQNRADLHLHGGRTPWISDGTPHQWIVPAADELAPNQPYKKGVSFENVPDMPDPGPGAMTYYWSNQQSARLMFWHDHAWGITRLNVVVGEAAGLILTDQWEQQLVDSGALPAEQIPLIIQDRTFVDPDTVRVTDPTWNWGTGTPDGNGIRPPVKGDLWFPHVYVPAQNPYDASGANPFGRWVYGPWFFPPTNNILHGPVPNPYHDPACSSTDIEIFATCTTPGQPPVIPGTPVPSVGMESFFDTAMVNGVPFPRLEIKPKAYRFRVLNAANDRFMNLSLYEADPNQLRAGDNAPNTEVKIVPAAVASWDPALYPLWPTDGREPGVPDPTTMGPPFIQVGTESGFLPRPVKIFSQPIGYFTDPTVFNFGNVKDHALLLGPAERADVVIDFSNYRGKTFILYNDAPAAFPARDARVDYYAGAPDLSDSGGHWGPQVGYGPNTRTIMQIVVADEAPPVATFTEAKLAAAMAPDLAAQPAPRPGIFEASQDPILVGQAAYNGVYTNPAGTDFVAFPSNWPAWGYARISDYNIQFKTVGGTLQSFPLEPKGIHDEMGAAFDMEYGRMSGNLGISIPFAQVGVANFTLYDYTDPATEVLNDAIEPLSPVLGDGTQIWKISQNGVDTHPIHFHVFDVQLLNRVGWDGLIRPPDANELGWKETVRISPLEDTIVAMRMWAPQLPFGVPTSLRPLNPGIPVGSAYGFTNIDPITQQPKVPADVNRVEDFGWEYVWHCHILSHEEMDMMRPVVLNVETTIPAAPADFTVADGAGGVVLSWKDPTPVDYELRTGFGLKTAEIGFRIERAEGPAGAFAFLANQLANRETYTDTTAAADTYYRYRVITYNAAGATSSAVAARVPAGTATPVSSVALSASPATTPYARVLPTVLAPADGSVAFTATPTGGAGLFEYRFSLSANAGATYDVVQAFSAADVWVLPSTQPAGVYRVMVEVRTSAGEATPYQFAELDYEVQSNPGTVALAAGAPSPHVYGTAVLFTATPTGGAATKEYRFSLDAGTPAGFVVQQNWSASATWSMPAATLPATYQVKVESRSDLSPTGIASATLAYTVRYAPATALSLVANKASPAIKTIIPTPTVFNAMASGSQGYKYRFKLFDGTTTTVVQDWSAGASWVMPASQPVGNYVVSVEVSTDGGLTADLPAKLKLMNLIAKAATGVSVTATPAGPQSPGTAVTVTAVGAGSAGYHYRFSRSVDGGAYEVVQDWSPIATHTLAGSLPRGTYRVIADVWANSSGSGPDLSSAPLTIQIGTARAQGVTVTPSLQSPQLQGTAVAFTAAGEGSTGYQYRFFRSADGGATWTMVRDWNAFPTYTLPAYMTAATYLIYAEVRTAPSGERDAVSSMVTFTIGAVPAQSVTVSASLNSPQPPGTAVTFTATAEGSASYSFRFFRSSNGGASWTMVRDWSSVATYSLPSYMAIGSYQIYAEVRTSTLVARDAVSQPVTFVIANAPAQAVTVTASLESPQLVGTAVTFTAAGEGSTGYTYRFFRSANGGATWTMVRDWSAVASYTLPNYMAPAAYQVYAEVRTSALVARDAVSPIVNFVINAIPAQGVTLTTDLSSPQPQGTAVIFTAAGDGSTGYAYRFFRSADGGATWVMVRDWSTTSTYTLPSYMWKATYQIYAEVRTSAQVVRDAVSPTIPFVIQ